MVGKILRWTGISLVAVIVLFIITGALKKTATPVETATSIAQRKAKTGVKCTPETNINCFVVTAATLKKIKEMQNGLSRKNNQ
jgi:hypothetical protein